jgi:hypothetical protein
MGMARPFSDSGAELVALSLGAGGLLLRSAHRAMMAKPPRVKARNPVGAGDALLAAVAWALERDLPLEDVARWGVAAGTAAAMSEGVAMIARAQVQSVYRGVVTEPVSLLENPAVRLQGLRIPPQRTGRFSSVGSRRKKDDAGQCPIGDREDE